MSPRLSFLSRHSLTNALILTTCCPFALGLPAQAQQPAGWSLDHWECQGESDFTINGQTAKTAWPSVIGPAASPPNNIAPPAALDFSNPNLGSGAAYTTNANSAGTLTAVYQWKGPSGSQPTPLSVLITSAAAAGMKTTNSASANDGNSDKALAGTGSWNGWQLPALQVSAGKRLFNQSGSSTTARVSISPSASDHSTGKPGENGCFADVSMGVALDTRSVNISCPMVDGAAGSCYKEPAITGTVIYNTRQPDGTMRGDSAVYSGSGHVLDFNGNISGNWFISGVGNSSHYNWYSSLSSHSLDGYVQYSQDPLVFSVPVYFGTAAGSVDHVHISLQDPNDTANATANYYMHYHAQYEPTSWPEDSGYPAKVMGPDPEMPTWPVYGWHNETNPKTGIPDIAVGPASAAASFPYTGSETVMTSVDGGIEIGKEPVAVHFGIAHDISNTTETSGIISSLPTYLPQGFETWAVWHLFVMRHKGHLDYYGQTGYQGVGIWRKDDTVAMEHAVMYPYFKTNNSAFPQPAAGWTPLSYSH